jgi:hypothetical protein
MANNFFLGALPSYDGGYSDTPEGDEGRIVTTAPRTSDVTRSDAAPSPMFQTYTPPAPLPSQGQPQGGSGRTPVPSDVPSEDKPDVPQGGSTQGEDTGGEGDGDNAGGFKLSTPLLVLGAAAIYFFFFRKKQ